MTLLLFLVPMISCIEYPSQIEDCYYRPRVPCLKLDLDKPRACALPFYKYTDLCNGVVPSNPGLDSEENRPDQPIFANPNVQSPWSPWWWPSRSRRKRQTAAELPDDPTIFLPQNGSLVFDLRNLVFVKVLKRAYSYSKVLPITITNHDESVVDHVIRVIQRFDQSRLETIFVPADCRSEMYDQITFSLAAFQFKFKERAYTRNSLLTEICYGVGGTSLNGARKCIGQLMFPLTGIEPPDHPTTFYETYCSVSPVDTPVGSFRSAVDYLATLSNSLNTTLDCSDMHPLDVASLVSAFNHLSSIYPPELEEAATPNFQPSGTKFDSYYSQHPWFTSPSTTSNRQKRDAGRAFACGFGLGGIAELIHPGYCYGGGSNAAVVNALNHSADALQGVQESIVNITEATRLVNEKASNILTLTQSTIKTLTNQISVTDRDRSQNLQTFVVIRDSIARMHKEILAESNKTDTVAAQLRNITTNLNTIGQLASQTHICSQFYYTHVTPILRLVTLVESLVALNHQFLIELALADYSRNELPSDAQVPAELLSGLAARGLALVASDTALAIHDTFAINRTVIPGYSFYNLRLLIPLTTRTKLYHAFLADTVPVLLEHNGTCVTSIPEKVIWADGDFLEFATSPCIDTSHYALCKDYFTDRPLQSHTVRHVETACPQDPLAYYQFAPTSGFFVGRTGPLQVTNCKGENPLNPTFHAGTFVSFKNDTVYRLPDGRKVAENCVFETEELSQVLFIDNGALRQVGLFDKITANRSLSYAMLPSVNTTRFDELMREQNKRSDTLSADVDDKIKALDERVHVISGLKETDIKELQENLRVTMETAQNIDKNISSQLKDASASVQRSRLSTQKMRQSISQIKLSTDYTSLWLTLLTASVVFLALLQLSRR